MGNHHEDRSAVNGFLNLNKPVGITSMEALRRVKRITGQRKKVGHAGTIDPLAEGVLPICFGQGTRLMEQVVAGRKRYRMTLRLGASSATYDAEGTITEQTDPSHITRSDIAAELVNFVGLIDQVPPMYSAIKVDGRRLYELARSGQEIARKSRQVQVYAISIDEIAMPHLTLTVDCGRGTYLRSIAHDLGMALGCGGYVTSLSRLSCGEFKIEDSVSLEDLEQSAVSALWRAALHPVDWALRNIPAIALSPAEERAIGNGQPIEAARPRAGGAHEGQIRAYNENGVFLALLSYKPDDGRWQPTKVFRNDTPSPYSPGSSRPAGDRLYREPN